MIERGFGFFEFYLGFYYNFFFRLGFGVEERFVERGKGLGKYNNREVCM